MGMSDPASSGHGLSDPRITPAMEDYLKAIYHIEHDGHPVTTQRLAEDLQISGASVSNMVKRLNDLHLLVHNPYRGVALTPAGTAVAMEVLRHHRLLELYLSQALGFDIDQVHMEADRLEHHVSEELESRMEKALGFPEFDPHGHPIPTRSGTIPSITDIPLSELAVNQPAIVSRVNDRDPQSLRQIDALGIRPGVNIKLVSRSEDTSLIALNDQERKIPSELTGLIHVLQHREASTS